MNPDQRLPDSAIDEPPSPREPNSEALRRFVREEVEQQVQKERQLLKESVALAAKIVGGAIALFFAVFTIFGLTTWSDIKKEAISVVKAQTEELIKKSDSEASVKDNLTTLLNRTVVAAALATNAREPRQTLVLAINDWDRLRAWIKVESLPLQDFKDVLAVLNAQEATRRATDANQLLGEMLNPPEKSPYNWMVRQPEKRAAILENFRDRGLGSVAADLVNSPALTESFRADAANYVRDVGFSEGVDRLLESYLKLKNGPAKQKVLLACLELRPDHLGVHSAFASLLAAQVTSYETYLVAEAISTLPKLRSFPSEADSEVAKQLSKKLLTFAVRNDIYFTLEYDEELRSLVGRTAQTLETDPHFTVWISTSKTSSSSHGTVPIDQFRTFDSYWDLLASAATAGDAALVKALLPGRGSDRHMFPRAGYGITLQGATGARLVLSESGSPPASLELSSLSDAPIIVWGGRESAKPKLMWTDKSGKDRQADVLEFKGTGFKFALQPMSRKAKSVSS